ncbi:MAG: VOC family protein [Owenweeksia sp.]
MQTVHRMMINILSNNLEASKHFYTTLFDFEVLYDSDWFLSMASKDKKHELGIIQKDHEIVPSSLLNGTGSVYLTLITEDVNALFEKVRQTDFHILEEPRDTFYGQRRMLLQDPNHVVVDVSSPIPDFQFQ